MSGTMRLTDELIRAALAPTDDVRVPADLGEGIRAEIATTPQRRAPLLGALASPRARLALQLAVLGLLALALVGAIWLVGSRHSDLPSSLGVSTYHGGPERNGVMPGPAPARRPDVEWKTSLAGPIGAGSPVVVDGTIFVADGTGFVTAVDESSGTIRWRHPVGASINSGVSVAGGLVVVGDEAGMIHALAVPDGKERWRHAIGGRVHSAAVIVDGTVYDGSLDGNLLALDLKTGTVRWGPILTPGPISRSIAFTNGLIFAGSGGSSAAVPATLAAYDASAGTIRWSQVLMHGNTSTVTVSDGRVFVTSGLDAGGLADHRLYAFDATTGESAWQAPFAASSRATLLICAVAGGVVYACGDDGWLYAIDAATGRYEWHVLIHSTQSPNGGYVGGVIYVTSDDQQVHAIDVSTHAESWSVPVTGLPSAPAILDGRIIVGTSLGKLESLTSAAAREGSPSPSAP